jgi:hypothetical protein
MHREVKGAVSRDEKRRKKRERLMTLLACGQLAEPSLSDKASSAISS